MSELRQLASNTAIQILGRIAGTTFGVFTIAFMTRALGADGYGQFTVAFTFLAIAGALADLGFTLTTTQLISEDGAHERAIVSTAFTARLVSGCCFFGLAVLLAFFMPYAPQVKLAIAVGSFSFFAMTASQMLIGVFQKHLALWRPALSEAVSRGFILLLIFFLARSGADSVRMMGAFAVGNTLLLLMNVGFARRYIPFTLTIDFSLLKHFLSKSWPIAASIFFNLLYLKGDIFFMSILGRSDAEIGHYGAAYKVLDVIAVIPTMFMGLLLPIMTRAWSARRFDLVRQSLQRAVDLFALLSFPILVGATFLATPLMRLVAGESFADSGPLLMILMIANTAVFFGILFSHGVIAVQKQRRILPAFMLTAVVTCLLYLWSIPRWGATGAAWSTVASEVLIALMSGVLVIRAADFRPRLRAIFVAALASCFMGAFLWWILPRLGTTPIMLVADILLGACIYAIFAFAFGGIKRETLRALFAAPSLE